MASKGEELNVDSKHTSSISILSKITLEPLVLIYILPSTINYLITQNLILEQSCRVNLGLDQSICDAIMNRNSSGFTKTEELSVQMVASNAILLKTLASGLIPIIILFFLGSWSDNKERRKPCILGPILGELIAITCLILNLVFSRSAPAVLTALAYSLPTAISGGLPCLFLGVYSYVSTCSSGETMTMRIGGISAIQKIAYVMGFGISGIILNLFGFIGAYSTTFFMILSSFIYGYYLLKERTEIVKDIVEEVHDLEDVPVQITKKMHVLEHFFHTILVLFTERPNNKRMRLMASVVLLMIVNGPLQGEQSVFFLYTKFKFGWNHWQYGFFYAGQFVTEIFGSLLVLLILIRFFKWKDESLGILSFISSIVAGIIFAGANDGIWFSIGALANLFGGTSQIALRSLMSKLVQNHEIGKTNSIFQISESLMHLIFGTIYTMLYQKTVHVYPGSVFLFSSALKVIGIFIFIWLFKESIKHQKRKIKESETTKNEKMIA